MLLLSVVVFLVFFLVWFCFSLEENISYRYKFKTFGVTFLVFTKC